MEIIETMEIILSATTPKRYFKKQLPRTAGTMVRTGQTPEATAKLLTAFCTEMNIKDKDGSPVTVTSKKLRSQATITGQAAFKSLQGKQVQGTYQQQHIKLFSISLSLIIKYNIFCTVLLWTRVLVILLRSFT